MLLSLVYALAKSLAKNASGLLRLASAGERGTGITELAMLSFLASSSVLATAVISSTDVSIDKFTSVFNRGINEVSGAMEVRGAVIVTAKGAPMKADTVQFSLGTFGDMQPLS